MDVQVFTLCDFAEDFNGKLCIVGTFDTIHVVDFSKNMSVFSIAVRIVFDQGEKGTKKVQLTIRDDIGQDFVPPMDGQFEIKESGTSFNAANLVINLGGVSFKKPGIYFASLKVDGTLIKGIQFRAIKAG